MKTLLLLMSLTVTGTARFEADTLGGLVKVKSSGCKVTGDVESGVFKADLATCKDEKYETRDEHTKKKYLEVGKFPQAKLTIAPVAAGTRGSFAWTGTLELKGQTAPVSGQGTFDGSKLVATFKVNLDDYPAVGAPSNAGVVMDKLVSVTFEGDVK